MNVKTLPLQERPRERFASKGKDALSISELIAILLGSGTKGRSVLALSQTLLSHFGSLRRLSEASLPELCEVKGIGRAKALQLQAVFALLYRLEEEEVGMKCDDSEKLFPLLQKELGSKKVEELMVILLDVKKRLMHREIIAKGTLTELLLHPREIFHVAVHHRAHSILIAHNHPSGDPTPSLQDLEMTRTLLEAGRMIGIELLDHLVVGRTSCVSLRQQGVIP